MTDLVPLKRVYFRGREVRYADLPYDTRDIRWRACIQHRFACDCREAEFAEERQEMRGEMRHLRQIFDTVLKGHATWGVNEFDQCNCTGCQIARDAYMRFHTTVDKERRETLGLPSRLGFLYDGEAPF